MKFHQAALHSVCSEGQGNNRKQIDVGVKSSSTLLKTYLHSLIHRVASLKLAGAQGTEGRPPAHLSAVRQ